MNHSGNDQPIDVSEDFVERFGIFRRFSGQRAANGARLAVWSDRHLSKIFPKVRDPIGELMQLLSKNFGRGVAKLRLSILHREKG